MTTRQFRSNFSAILCLLFLFSGSLSAQDKGGEITSKDLEIPGVETEAKGDDLGVRSERRGGTRNEKSLLEMIKTGGWAMWPLGFFSVLLVALVVFNLINLRRVNFAPEGLETGVRTNFDRLDLEGAAGQASSGSTCLGHIILNGVQQIGSRGYGVMDTERFEDHLMDASRNFNRGRARVVNYFSVLAQAAPMLGLLGTVSGMIKAFAGLGRQGMSRPDELASNISEALVTTAAGLLIALPALFLYFIFRDKLQRLVALSDERGFQLFEHLRQVVVGAGAQAQAGAQPQAAAGQQAAGVASTGQRQAASAAQAQQAPQPPQPPQPPGTRQPAASGGGGPKSIKLPSTKKKGGVRPAVKRGKR